MKRLSLILLSAVLLLSLSACNGKEAQDTSSKISEKDIFEYIGTESEYDITKSEVKELFENQSTVSSSDESSKDDTSSKEDSSNESDVSSSGTSSENDTSSQANESNDESSSDTTSTNDFDKDGDGWTDVWQ